MPGQPPGSSIEAVQPAMLESGGRLVATRRRKGDNFLLAVLELPAEPAAAAFHGSSNRLRPRRSELGDIHPAWEEEPIKSLSRTLAGRTDRLSLNETRNR